MAALQAQHLAKTHAFSWGEEGQGSSTGKRVERVAALEVGEP